jgi:hypothetical protein
METDTKIIWERDGYWDLGYTPIQGKDSKRTRFVLNMDSNGDWRLEEILRFKDQWSAIAHAEQRAQQTEVS